MRLFGDIPIYVAPRRAPTTRAHPELFQDGLVAGAPPDALSAVGQLWGNPLYDWRASCRRRATAGGSSGCAGRSSSYDLARIDHFRGFVSYWAVPEGNRTAQARPLAARPGCGRSSARQSASSAGSRSSPRTSA